MITLHIDMPAVSDRGAGEQAIGFALPAVRPSVKTGAAHVNLSSLYIFDSRYEAHADLETVRDETFARETSILASSQFECGRRK
jgi:hypothetical protein